MTFKLRRDFKREAVFFFITPFWTERSSALTAEARSFRAPSASLASIAVRNFLTCVRMLFLLRRLTAVRRSIWRTFLIAEDVLAMKVSKEYGSIKGNFQNSYRPKHCQTSNATRANPTQPANGG